MNTDCELSEMVGDARRRTLALVADLTDDQMIGPRLDIVNPLLWEIAHVAWFQERWVLRHALGRPPLIGNGDALYDSSTVPHDSRWELPLPSRRETLAYVEEIRSQVQSALSRGEIGGAAEYFVRLSIAHEDMHDEAFVITRQTLGYAAPPWMASRTPGSAGPFLKGDARVPGGTFILGAVRGKEPFVHDNEKWAHSVQLGEFRIARAAVTQSEFADFVSAGGYRQRRYWSAEGWQWREAVAAEHPVYWRRAAGHWERREFDRWLPLEPQRPVIHVNWFEAEAFCRFARRRLPTEAEWEAAACGEESLGRSPKPQKRRFPWGDEPPNAKLANLDGDAAGCVDAAELAAGDSPFGCRQMIGNVWEWTASPFQPFPDFAPDPYKEYSQPWFKTHRVLRGGCWVTRRRLIRNTWRNFYTADRRDVLAGFRTCAV
jgi:iron(II)-dependent oxidoreductase